MESLFEKTIIQEVWTSRIGAVFDKLESIRG
jgi:hypothetical protein